MRYTYSLIPLAASLFIMAAGFGIGKPDSSPGWAVFYWFLGLVAGAIACQIAEGEE